MANPRTKLKALREAKRISALDLANKLGIHRAEVYRVESGERDPSFKVMMKWLEVLDCDVDLFR